MCGGLWQAQAQGVPGGAERPRGQNRAVSVEWGGRGCGRGGRRQDLQPRGLELLLREEGKRGSSGGAVTRAARGGGGDRAQTVAAVVQAEDGETRPRRGW